MKPLTLQIVKYGLFVLFITTCTTANKDLDPKCKSLNVSLTQKIDNEGFHRQLNWLLERGPKSVHCKLAIRLDISKEMYMNPDEIADLNRLNISEILIDRDVDIEAPAHLAEEHTAYIYIPPFLDKVSFNIPFHLRYQKAQISGGFGKVPVNKPTILAICPQSCSNTEIRAPCDTRNYRVMCAWDNVSYQALFDEMELMVPVGNLDDYPLVSIITLLLGCAGCIYTLSVLSTTPL